MSVHWPSVAVLAALFTAIGALVIAAWLEEFD